MGEIKLPETWLRGALPEVPALLQPVAHALLQAKEEIHEMLEHFSESQLWKRPAGLASVSFHLQHIAGVQDRLFTYARAEQLNETQLEYLKIEGKQDEKLSVNSLLNNLDEQTFKSIAQLIATDVSTLTETRTVGRKQIPSTVIGLLVHAAEHTMRHTGQLIVTVKILSLK
jgi:uncharacterized damage-inducible protein DinB